METLCGPRGDRGPRGPPILSFAQTALPVPRSSGPLEGGQARTMQPGPGSGLCLQPPAWYFCSHAYLAPPWQPRFLPPSDPPPPPAISGKGHATWLSLWAASLGLLPALSTQALSHCWAAGHSPSPRAPFPPTLATLSGQASTLHHVEPLAGQAGKAGPERWALGTHKHLSRKPAGGPPPASHQQERDGDGKNADPPGGADTRVFPRCSFWGGRQRQCPQVAERDCQGTSRPVPREGLLSKLWYPQAGTSTCKPVFTAPPRAWGPPAEGFTSIPRVAGPGQD